MLKAVIFDFDGVLVDTFELAYGISLELNPGITREEYKKIFDGNLFDHKIITEENAKKFDKRQDELFHSVVIHEHTKEELLKLKEKYELFIITSNREYLLKNCFEKHGLEGVFSHIMGAETHKKRLTSLIWFLKNILLKNVCL